MLADYSGLSLGLILDSFCFTHSAAIARINEIGKDFRFQARDGVKPALDWAEILCQVSRF